MGTSTANLTVGPYRGHTRLASGGGGEVWEADGPRGAAAIKVARTETQRAALRRELEVLRRLDHPHIVRCLDGDPDEGWMAMDLVRGPSATEWAVSRSTSELVEFGALLADALAHLHTRDVIHNDLKPDNVLVDGDEPRLIDLGLANIPTDGDAQGFQGTLGYAAPEQLARRRGSKPADVYALGALLYRLLTGRPPFAAEDEAALTWLPLHSLPEPPSSLLPGMPGELEILLLSMLARTPEHRPSAAELPGLLRAARTGPPRRVVIGMNAAREPLRQAVVRLTEGRGGVFVLHGQEGSGRRAIIREAVAAARREGIHIISKPLAGCSLTETVLRAAAPSVLALDGAQAVALDVAEAVLTQQPPVLCLLRSDQAIIPLERMGARHIAPAPLEVAEVERLMIAYRHDPTHAAVLHRATRGLPGAVYGQLRQGGASALSTMERRLLRATTRRAVPIPRLAEALAISELAIVDLAEPLIDRGLMVELEDGACLMAARG